MQSCELRPRCVSLRPQPGGRKLVGKTTLEGFDESLRRCNTHPAFLDRFYDKFLTSSPKVREKFTHTDFVRQQRALRASLHLMPLAAEDPENGPARYLR